MCCVATISVGTSALACSWIAPVYLLLLYIFFTLATIWAMATLQPPPQAPPAAPPQEDDYTIQDTGAPGCSCHLMFATCPALPLNT